MKKSFILILVLFITIFFEISINAQSKDYLEKNEHLSLLANTVETSLRNSNDGDYPDYYGGIYINDDSTNLIIQIIREKINDTGFSNILNNFINENNEIKIEYVENSYNDLLRTYNNIQSYNNNSICNTIINHEIEYTGSYVDVINNKIIVGYDNTNLPKEQRLTQEKEFINKIKRNTDKPNIIVFQNSPKGTEQIDLKGGQELFINGISTCSMGYRAKLNGKNGYVTAGHCVNGYTANVASGTVKKYQYSGTVDASFIETNSLYNPLNDLMYTSAFYSKLNTNTPNLYVGSAIAHVGKTSGYKEGKIKSLFYSKVFGNTEFKSLILADYEALAGDSGGTVFVPASSAGTVPLVGIHKGKTTDGTVIVKASEINTSFGITRY